MAAKLMTSELQAACTRYYNHFGQMYPYSFNGLTPDEAIKEIEECLQKNTPISLEPYQNYVS